MVPWGVLPTHHTYQEKCEVFTEGFSLWGLGKVTKALKSLLKP